MSMRISYAALALLALAAPLQSQTPINVDELRAHLQSESDMGALRRREFALRRNASVSTEANLERGLVLLRLYQMTKDDSDAKQSRDALEKFTKKAINDARGYYALGLARTGGPDVHVPSPFGVLNSFVIGQSIAEVAKRDPISLAKRDYKRALAIDPNYVGPALQLARLSIDGHDKDNLQSAANALRHIVTEKVGGPEAATMLSQVEEALGNTTAAASAAEAAANIADEGHDSTAAVSAALAHAVALLRQHDRQEVGAREYFKGVELLTDQLAESYYRTLRPIVSDREQADWQGADLSSKKAWLKRFWDVRAAAAGVTVGERMAAHYNRLADAQDKYRRQGSRGSNPGGSLVWTKYKDAAFPFDDRGVIYVRHGAPMEIVRTSHPDLRPNETWVYSESGKYTLYNFVVQRDGAHYHLVDDVLNALDPSTRGIPVDAATKLLRDRQPFEPRYAALAQKFDSYETAQRNAASGMFSGEGVGESMASAGSARVRIASDMRAQALVALNSDSDRPDFKGDLPFYYDLYSFKGKNGTTDVTFAAAIPGTSLFSESMGTQFIYSLQASVIFIDTATQQITRKDTVLTFLSSRLLTEKQNLRVTLDMTVAYSKANLHRVVLRDRVNPGVGQMYGGLAELKNFSGTQFMVSDVVLAESEDGGWQRGDARLGLVPPRQFEEKKPLKLFYELYNLPAGTNYRTEITMAPVEGITGFGRLRKLLGGSDGRVQLRFDGVAPTTSNGTIQELKEVSTEMKPGKYRVVVRVTNLENQQAVRSETLFIVSPQKK